MMIRTIFYLLIYTSGLLMTGCNVNKHDDHATSTGISGRYINKTFLEQVLDSVAGNIQGYCYEMNFISADSVDINYGFEKGTLGYKKKGENNYVLLAALQGNDLDFTLHQDSTIILHDSVWISHDNSWRGIPLNSKFGKVPDTDGSKWLFNQYLNEKKIAGRYILYQEGQLKDQEVVFKSDGKVNGLFTYTNYAICFSGDCVGETEIPNDIISFSRADGEVDSYVFTVDSKNNTIGFYEIGDPIKDAGGQVLKGGRSVGKLIFELKR